MNNTPRISALVGGLVLCAARQAAAAPAFPSDNLENVCPQLESAFNDLGFLTSTLDTDYYSATGPDRDYITAYCGNDEIYLIYWDDFGRESRLLLSEDLFAWEVNESGGDQAIRRITFGEEGGEGIYYSCIDGNTTSVAISYDEATNTVDDLAIWGTPDQLAAALSSFQSSYRGSTEAGTGDGPVGFLMEAYDASVFAALDFTQSEWGRSACAAECNLSNCAASDNTCQASCENLCGELFSDTTRAVTSEGPAVQSVRDGALGGQPGTPDVGLEAKYCCDGGCEPSGGGVVCTGCEETVFLCNSPLGYPGTPLDCDDATIETGPSPDEEKKVICIP